MTLLPGTRLGPCEILSTLGAGGMGDVFGAIALSEGGPNDPYIRVM
jgi:hypothetical protein